MAGTRRGAHIERTTTTIRALRAQDVAVGALVSSPGVSLLGSLALGLVAAVMGEGDVVSLQWGVWAGCVALWMEGQGEVARGLGRAGAEVVRDLALVTWFVVAGVVPVLAIRRSLAPMEPVSTLLASCWAGVVLYRVLRSRALARAGLKDGRGIPLAVAASAVLALCGALTVEHAGAASHKAASLTVGAVAMLVVLPVRWRSYRDVEWRHHSLTVLAWAGVAAFHAWRGGPAITSLAVFLQVTIVASLLEEAFFHRVGRPAITRLERVPPREDAAGLEALLGTGVPTGDDVTLAHDVMADLPPVDRSRFTDPDPRKVH